jgi:PKHD-type hydroxylase
MFSLEVYNSSKPTSNYNRLYHVSNVFTDEMIFHLENMVHSNYTFSKGRTGVLELGNDTDSYETNNRDIAYIRPADHSKWLYDLLFPIALEANKQFYHFDIDIVTDPIHYVVYPEDGGHLDWHMDVGGFGVNKRKLAMTVQLSDPNDYEGGDLQIWGGGKEPISVKRNKGDVSVFPTFLLHRVTPITRGQRKILVFWTGGRQFR